MNNRKEIAHEFAKTINSEDIIKIILFGSVARGDDSEESDIDILIVSNYRENIEDVIAEEVAWIMYDKNELISAHIMSEDRFINTQHFSFYQMFYQKVLKLDETQAFFDKSKKKLLSAHSSYDLEDYSSAVSLSYYSMFLVAKALILKKGVKAPKTHNGLIYLFKVNYIDQDDFSYEKYVYLADTQSDREDADYDAFDELDERIARKRIKQAEEFIAEAERFI